MTLPSIEIRDLRKTFGDNVAVDGLSFSAQPGNLTCLLGPNGAGKTTTLRMLLGLVEPSEGVATIGGGIYAELPRPTDMVGAALESSSFHPARGGRNHLRVYCAVNGYPDARADEVLELVGLTTAARRAVRGYSLGMRQRLGLAAALLGDPPVLVLDEPSNGLDPAGIAWLRGFLRELVSEGRTVLVSSHALSEVQQNADQVVIINRGRLVRAGRLDELTDGRARPSRSSGSPARPSAGLPSTSSSSRTPWRPARRPGADLLRPHRRRGGSAMKALVRAELRKLGTTPLWWLMLLLAMVLTVISTSAAVSFAEPGPMGLETQTGLRVVFAQGSVASLLVAILGIIAMTGEFNHQTATPTFLATPRRGRVVLAKLTMYAGVGVAFALACTLVVLAVALPGSLPRVSATR